MSTSKYSLGSDFFFLREKIEKLIEYQNVISINLLLV